MTRDGGGRRRPYMAAQRTADRTDGTNGTDERRTATCRLLTRAALMGDGMTRCCIGAGVRAGRVGLADGRAEQIGTVYFQIMILLTTLRAEIPKGAWACCEVWVHDTTP